MKRYVCEKCGKLIPKEEAEKSCQKLRKSMSELDPHIFDVWFWDYCNDCADKYIQSVNKGEDKLNEMPNQCRMC